MKLLNRFRQRQTSKNANFETQFHAFKELDKCQRLSSNWEDRFPCLNDNTITTGFDAHYVYHPAWAARIVKEINPGKHIDISSTLHFCSILSAFIKTEFYDYRPAMLNLDNLYSGKADLTDLHFETNSIESLSCMHTIEHVGLGRYGDPLDPEGDVKAINEIKRVVKPGGSILFVTPVGEPRIMFNAHRIYAPSMIIELFQGYNLKQFSLVNDKSEFILNASLEEGKRQEYGCGCFWFVKI
jgi:SAM-dependent methyltransferase